MAGQQFYNTSPLDFRRAPRRPGQIAGNLRAVHRRVLRERPGRHREVRLRHPDRPAATRANLLYQVIGKFADIDLHPDAVSNLEMGYLYEELIRRFSELSNETAGEHFTPREVIRLMVNLLFAEDDDVLTKPGRRARRSSTRPAAPAGCCRSPRTTCASLNPQRAAGGLRPGAERRDLRHLPLRHDAQGPGRLPHRLRQLLHRGRPPGARRFDYLLANPPFGVEWKKVEDDVRTEHEKLGLRRPVRCRAAAHQRRQLPVPPAHDLQDEAARRRAGAGWPSSSTARRCSPVRPVRGSRRSAAGSSRTTGWRPSSPCRTSSSTTPASRPTSGSSPTARPRAPRQGPAGRRPRLLGQDAQVASATSARRSATEQIDEITRLYARLHRGREGQDLPQRGVRLPADHRGAPMRKRSGSCWTVWTRGP